MLMPNSGRYVRLCIRLTILNLLKVYMNLFLRFFCFKFLKVLKQIMCIWIKWIMERCYLHLWWYFFVCPHLPQAHHVHIPAQGLWGSQADPWVEFVTISSRICHNLEWDMYQLGQNRCCWSKVGVLMAPKNPMAFLWYKCHIMGAFLWVCHVRRGGLSQNIVTSPQEPGYPCHTIQCCEGG